MKKIYEILASEKIAVTKYHAGLSGEERKQNLDDFIYDEKPMMVAVNSVHRRKNRRMIL